MRPRFAAIVGTVGRLVRCVRLFLGLVWREWEPRSCGIPDEYRVHYRFSVRDAWATARRIHAPNTRIADTGGANAIKANAESEALT